MSVISVVADSLEIMIYCNDRMRSADQSPAPYGSNRGQHSSSSAVGHSAWRGQGLRLSSSVRFFYHMAAAVLAGRLCHSRNSRAGTPTASPIRLTHWAWLRPRAMIL